MFLVFLPAALLRRFGVFRTGLSELSRLMRPAKERVNDFWVCDVSGISVSPNILTLRVF